MENYKYYRELYSRYRQSHLRTRKKEVKSRIAELEKIKIDYKPRRYKGMWKEEYMRKAFLRNCREL